MWCFQDGEGSVVPVTEPEGLQANVEDDEQEVEQDPDADVDADADADAEEYDGSAGEGDSEPEDNADLFAEGEDSDPFEGDSPTRAAVAAFREVMPSLGLTEEDFLLRNPFETDMEATPTQLTQGNPPARRVLPRGRSTNETVCDFASPAARLH